MRALGAAGYHLLFAVVFADGPPLLADYNPAGGGRGTSPALRAAAGGLWEQWLEIPAGQGESALVVLALRFQLEYRDAGPASQGWSWYALVVAASATGADALPAIDSLVAPRPLERLHLHGYARPVFAIRDWYRGDPDRRWGLYLLRLSAPEPRLAALGLEVQPSLQGRLPPETVAKPHGPMPTKVLVVEPAQAPELGGDALVCRARSPSN